MNKKDRWDIHCKDYSQLITKLNINNWVFLNEDNFRQFAEFGYITAEKNIFSYNEMDDSTYDELHDFINQYFDFDAQYFVHFQKAI